jgi:hypothetical protein
MPEATKYSNRLGTKPLNLTILLISALFFSIFLTFAYPPSIAYTHQVFFPVVFNVNDISLAWDSNSEPNVAGYKLYIGRSSGNYTQARDLGLTTICSIRDLIDGSSYFFAITAYNQNGLESGFSEEVQYP